MRVMERKIVLIVFRRLFLDLLVFVLRDLIFECVKNYVLKGSIGYSYRFFSSGFIFILRKKRKKL